MNPLLLLLFTFLLPFIQSIAVPSICLESSLGIAVSTNCSDLQLYKLNPGVCKYDLQALVLSLSDIEIFHFLGVKMSSIPIYLLSEKELEEIPKLLDFISSACPSYLSKNVGFLSLTDDTVDPYGFDLVYLNIYNSTGMSGNTGIYQDFFQKSPLVHRYEFEVPLNFSMKNMSNHFDFFRKDANYSIQSAKLYSQYCGTIPTTPIKFEVKLTRENPMTHTITNTLIKYFVLKEPFPDNLTTPEFHELIEVCLKNDKDNSTQHVLVDRVAKGQGIIEFWNSEIRINYIGEGDGCDLKSNKWTDAKDGSCDGGVTPCLIARATKTNWNYPMDKMLKICENFLLKFKQFNAWHNCQHFATGAWDLMTGDKLDYENWELVEVHSPASGLEPHLEFIDPVEL